MQRQFEERVRFSMGSWDEQSTDDLQGGSSTVKCLLTYVDHSEIWGFPQVGLPKTGCFIMENPIKMDDLGVPLF